MKKVCASLAVALLIPQVYAKSNRERAQIALPIVVGAATDHSTEVVGQAKIFGTQSASYRSVAVISSAVRLPNGLVLFDVGTRLVEHTAKGKTFNGSLYCKATRIGKNVALPCLGDIDQDGTFDSLWLSMAVIGSAEALSPALPRPDVERVDTDVQSISYSIEKPNLAENLRIGFYISGHNGLMGQTHFYLAISDASGVATVPIIATHKSPRIGTVASPVSIADGALSVQKTGTNLYNVSVVTPLKSGERELVQNYEMVTRVIVVPG